MIKKILCILVLTSQATLFLAAQGKKPGAVASEDARFVAMINKDAKALDPLLSERLIYVHSNGLIERKQDFIQSAVGGKIEYKSIHRDTVEIETWKKLSIINGIVSVTGNYNNSPFETRLKYLAVYRKQRGHWVLERWQSTKA